MIRPRLAVIGGTLTTGYLLLLGVYSYLDWHEFSTMKASEVANFLSGAFSPLAFLWLVLGFLQQGMELRHSAHALYLQQEELRNSVEQQQALVAVTREQLEMERLARRDAEQESDRIVRPRLVLHGGGWSSSGGDRKFQFKLENVGTACTDVDIQITPRGDRFERAALKAAESIDFELSYPSRTEIEESEIVVSFKDARGRKGKEIFLLPEKEQPNTLAVFGKPILLSKTDRTLEE